MKFLIITLAPTLKKGDNYTSYAPYVYEMNIWSKYVDDLGIVSPTVYDKELLVSEFDKKPTVFSIPNFSFSSLPEIVKSIFLLPLIFYKLIRAMQWADHIHLRCPGNVALLGCLVQILFPNKKKTAKYAGNWDPNAKQPLSYKIQKWILSNTVLTKNMQVLVYGEWENQSKNIKSFFTATYSEADKKEVQIRNLDDEIQFVFVGTLSQGKRPLLAVQIIEKLHKQGYNVNLSLYGEGEMRGELENYVVKNNLSSYVDLKGNQPKEKVKVALQHAHFLILPSKSEGWPKVVAEAMFWGCLPIVTPISCVPYMLDYGERGILITPEVKKAVVEIDKYMLDATLYQESCKKAISWSREYTLDKFEAEIKKMLVITSAH